MIIQGPEVCRWVMDGCGGDAHNAMQGIGWVSDRQMVAGVVFEDYSKHNVVAHQRQVRMAGRSFWKAVSEYAFDMLGVPRVTGPVPSSNHRAIKLNRHIGFEIEACLARAAYDGSDLLLMVLWRQNCRFLEW